jgi:catechol 2,3-dioxygenase-like lactoylglutathione lyase family enzyme
MHDPENWELVAVCAFLAWALTALLPSWGAWLAIPAAARMRRVSAGCRVRAVTTTLRRSAPVFITTDLSRALAHYERLGFTVQAYDDGDFYGYACRDGLEIHLAKVNGVDHATNTCCAYLWVDDASALHDEWAAAVAEGRLDAPVKTAYGLDEGAHVDPDGNLIRFGSPPLPPRALR